MLTLQSRLPSFSLLTEHDFRDCLLVDRAGTRETSAGATGELILSTLRRGWRRRRRRWRWLRAAPRPLWTATAKSGDPQTCVRPRATAGSAGVQATQEHTAAAAAAETLQDSVHQGTHSANAHRAAASAATAAGRGEDVDLRPGEETGRGARCRAADADTDAAQQTGGLLHPL